MDPIQFAIRNPVKVAVGVLLLVLFGLLSLRVIPVQLVPNVDQPIITVTTTWAGRSPEELERDVIEEQEDRLKNVSNLRKMTSSASVGQAQIELEFFVGTDIKSVRQEVSDSLREVPEYPAEVDEPVITDGTGGEGDPIAWLILTSDTPDFDVQTIGDLVEDRVKPFLERIPGVSEVRVYGGREREIHIEFDPARIAQRGITFNQLVSALRLENVNVSAGDLEDGKYDVRVRTVGQYDDLEQIRNTIVTYGEGGPVRIKDLATVRQWYEKQRSFVRSRGQTALAIPVYRETGANVIRIVEGTTRYAGLNGRVGELNRPDGILAGIARQVQRERDLPEPPQLAIAKVYDETGYIYDALSLVRTNLFIGGALAGLALLLFLRSVRPTLIVSLAIPISVIGTFVVMTAFGRNLNVISLAGLAFAVGMVVDAAIVVLENIDRHLGMGKRPRQAAYDGAREVWGAVLASALTTLAVFLPVLTIEEEAGQLFRDIALAICAAVTLSLIVAVTVIPASASRFAQSQHVPKTAALRAGQRLWGLASLMAWFRDAYAELIHWTTQRNAFGVGLRASVVGAFTLAAVLGAVLLMPPTDYLPRGNQNIVFGGMLTPPAYNQPFSLEIARRGEAILRPYWEATSYADLEGLPPIIHPFTQQVVEHIPPIDNYFFVSFNGGIFGGATSVDRQNVEPIGGLLSYAWSSISPGSIGFAEQATLFGRGLGGTRQIDVEIVGTDNDRVRQSGEALYMQLATAFGYGKVRPTPANFNLPGPEMRVTIDRVRAADLGIDVAALGLGVRALVDGITVGDYRISGQSIDIVARRGRDMTLSPDDLGRIPLAYLRDDGQRGTIPLASVARIERSTAPQSILRIEEQRAVKLELVPPEDVPLETAANQILGVIADLHDQGVLGGEVNASLGGSADKLAAVREAMLGKWYGWTMDSFVSLGFSRIFLALLVTYLLMAALFESFLYPFVIMFTVPLATVGGFMGLALIHKIEPRQQLDVLTMLGFVILIGIVVNNAILIVHQALNFMRGLGESEADRREALAPREAIRESVRTRLRPVFMTTLTSVCGMLPLVMMPGSGSELYRGLGSVVVGGLIVSTFFTLVVVPLLFSLVMDARLALLGTTGVEIIAPDRAPNGAVDAAPGPV